MESGMVTAARAQFGFTILFHYLFPILTMGLSILIAGLKTVDYFRGDDQYGAAARFWAEIFAINFIVGVVTGIPMEFQFGTNWAVFSTFAGGVIGQPLAMEGAYAFLLESTFLGLFLFGAHRVSRRVHWIASLLVAGGATISGYFIVCTNAWMQHPVGSRVGSSGAVELSSLSDLILNPFAVWQFAHVLCGSLFTAAAVMAGIGAYYTLMGLYPRFALISLRVGALVGLVSAVLQVFPTGDFNGAAVTRFQPVKLAAMEGLFRSEKGAPLAIIGMPDEEHHRLIDPIEAPRLLSFLAYGNDSATVRGLESYQASDLPPISLTYYAYHIMVGLGTLFIPIMGMAVLLLRRSRLIRSRWLLWILMLQIPFPYIANEAGWIVTEVGRQPWLIYHLQRTSAGVSSNVSAGETIFTLLGFAGLYTLLGILFLFLIVRKIAAGPRDAAPIHADGSCQSEWSDR